MNKQIKTVLIVDDEDYLREVISEVLSMDDIDSIQAEDGETALSVSQSNKDKIDLVFLDLNLPNTSGKEVYYQLKQILPNVPFVFMSGYGQEAVENDLPEDETYIYLKKPFNIHSIHSIVEQLNQKND